MKKIILLLLIFLVRNICISQSKIILVYDGPNSNVTQAVKKANEILNTKLFYDSISERKGFENSMLTGKDISDRIEKATQKINIVEKFKPKANACTIKFDEIIISRDLFGRPDKNGGLFWPFKKRRFNLSDAVNTLIHETVHAVDILKTGNEFGHDGNLPNGPKNTAPWVIGKIAEDMAVKKA